MFDLGAWNWSNIMQTAIAAGAGTFAFSWINERRTRRKHGAYLALRLAVLLEDYAENCLDLIYSTRNYFSSNGIVGYYQTRLPELEEYPPDDEGWRSLPLFISEMAINFPRKIAAHQSHLGSIQEYEAGHSSEMAAHCSDMASDIGLEAWKVAAELKQYYSFQEPRRELRAKLTEERQKVIDQEAAYRAKAAVQCDDL